MTFVFTNNWWMDVYSRMCLIQAWASVAKVWTFECLVILSNNWDCVFSDIWWLSDSKTLIYLIVPNQSPYLGATPFSQPHQLIRNLEFLLIENLNKRQPPTPEPSCDGKLKLFSNWKNILWQWKNILWQWKIFNGNNFWFVTMNTKDKTSRRSGLILQRTSSKHGHTGQSCNKDLWRFWRSAH